MSTYLWQNFLKDSAIRSYIWENIAKFYKIANAQALIEIGPWKGAITKKIKDISENFFVIEKDLTGASSCNRIKSWSNYLPRYSSSWFSDNPF